MELASDKMKSYYDSRSFPTVSQGWRCRMAACSAKEERYLTQALSTVARSLRGYKVHKCSDLQDTAGIQNKAQDCTP